MSVDIITLRTHMTTPTPKAKNILQADCPGQTSVQHATQHRALSSRVSRVVHQKRLRVIHIKCRLLQSSGLALLVSYHTEQLNEFPKAKN
eukprot:529322-Amphidinium_carterae.1